MRSLEARISRLEAKRKQKNNRAPNQHEYLDAYFRQRTRRLYNAKSRLAGEEWAWSRLSESDREMLRNDTPEQRAKDEGVEERWRRVHGATEGTTGHANAARQRLRSVSRVGVAE